MAIYLDEPLDDELLFSIVARYIQSSMVLSKVSFLNRLFGVGRIVENTGLIAQETYACWGLSAQEVAKRMTLHPYLAAFLSPDQAQKRLEYIASANYRPRGSNGRGVKLEGERYRHRYCRSCFRESIQSGDPSHWRRTHQLPGVIFCVRHQELLYEWEYTYYLHKVVAAGQVEGKRISIEATERQRSALLKIAKISDDALNNRIVFESRDFVRRFKEYLFSKSRYFWGPRYDQCVARLVERAFGAMYVSKYNIDLGQAHFRKIRGVGAMTAFRVITAAALITQIEEDETLVSDMHYSDLFDDVPSDLIRSKGMWPRPIGARPSSTCPSKLASHGAGHAIEHWRRRTDSYRGQCNCGMAITYTPGIDGVPVIRIVDWGEPYKNEVTRLVQAGGDLRSISIKLGISQSTVKTIMTKAGFEWRTRAPSAPCVRNPNINLSIECPSVVASHGRGHEIDHMRWVRRRYCGRCECGLTVVCDRLPNGEYVFRVSVWGDLYTREVWRLIDLGFSRNEIAIKMNVPIHVVDVCKKKRKNL
ncbi:hypothetical protein BLA50215_00553 [Burkholderia lata]|uniref:TnsD family Tn7-like transposition protein n=1 Tax=Burkholderia lata (strain ATCC 17760 / DSM 23089 / LMG 22485 / NCIMB 9086 / R18194 / 383) TaxID=482957 RepID=UPI001453F7E2|nr:TnsD family Tn7-like transposition protein [Burkholderia lata]VWC71298.1 hypothetical protein BLA50215_00553 [Burkholderia lata]